MTVKDSNCGALTNGDSAAVSKNLNVKGTSLALKRGTVIRDVLRNDDGQRVECNAETMKDRALKTCSPKTR